MLQWLKNDFRKRVCNQRGTWMAIAFAGVGWGIAGAATYVGVTSAQKEEKKKKQIRSQEEQKASESRLMQDKLLNTGEMPTPEAADDQAKLAMEKRKRMQALSGGKTILSSQGPTLTSGGGKSLLGS